MAAMKKSWKQSKWRGWMNEISRFLGSAEDTQKFAADLAKLCVVGDVILLYGEVGAGKTTFARGFIQSFVGVDEEIVSPTFSLVQQYGNIYHCDFYRLKHASELMELGLDEAFARGITLIEWAELIENELPDALRITLAIEGEGRKMEIKGTEKWQNRLKNLE